MNKDNREITILKEIQALQMPAGAIYLSQKLQIPQGSLGRILTSLEASGLLIKEQNKGRILTEKGEQYLIDYTYRMNQLNNAETLINIVEDITKERLIEIVEMRILLECTAIETACRSITDEQLIILEDILLDNSYEVRKGLLGEATDLQLHLTLAKFSGNVTLYQILRLLLTQNNSFSRLTDTRNPELESSVTQHEEILKQLRKRDATAACAAMKRHLEQLLLEINIAYHES
ncbi:MAG: FCD domain-containing protein [Eubacteriales bacterium]